MKRISKLIFLFAAVSALSFAARARAEDAKQGDKKPAEPSVTERLDVVEVKANDAVVKGDIPGSFRIPGSEVSLRLYGYAELDWVHDFTNDNSDIDYSTFAPYLPLHGDVATKRGRDYFTARESRVGLEAGMPTKYGVLSMKIEGDFNNEPRNGNSSVYGVEAGDYNGIYTQQATNSYGFRLRHAYGSFGGLTIGQTWSTFMDVDNFPETVDYNGPLGATFIRQPQIRYAYATPKAGTFTAALENSSTYVLDPASGTPVPASASRMPDLVLRWDRGFEFGALSLRGMTQELRLRDAGVDAVKRGFGVAASGLVKTRGRDFLTFGVTYGTGVGRYLNYVEGAAYDAANDEIVLESAVGGYLGYQVKVSDALRFNFAYGFVYELDGDYVDFAKANDFDHGRFGVNRFVQQGHAGFFVTPVAATDFGLEAIYASRKTLAGEKGDDFRMNFVARFYIN